MIWVDMRRSQEKGSLDRLGEGEEWGRGVTDRVPKTSIQVIITRYHLPSQMFVSLWQQAQRWLF